jgi:hypothetical protein
MIAISDDKEWTVAAHLTDRMREHYSTVAPDEQRESIGNVIRLVRRPPSGVGPLQSGVDTKKATRG